MNIKNLQTSFLSIFFISLILCIVLLSISGWEFRNRQNRIVEIYEQHIARQDSIRMNNISSLSRICREKEERIKVMLSDSTIDDIPSLCEKQRAAVKNFIKPCWEVTTRELISTDSINQAPAYDNDEKNEIKTLLELEFNKIQSEYESLEIWSALITIVFLVFSFYSLFKLERIEDQARGKVEELTAIKKSAVVEMERTKNVFDEYKEYTEKKVQELLNDSESKVGKLSEGMNRYVEATKIKMNYILDEKTDQLDNLRIAYNQKIEDLEDLMSSMQLNIEHKEDSES